MRNALRCIDKALRELYHLDSPHRPEDFLAKLRGADPGLEGALLVQEGEEEASVGIFLSDEVRRRLDYFPFWPRSWSREQLSAFTVAVEEVSHFHYFVHHASRGRSISQLELEIQGDIDKFLVAYFAKVLDRDSLTRQLFEHFRLAENLTAEQKNRYETANSLARQFVQKYHGLMENNQEALFRFLRRYYRLDAAEKIGLLAA